MPLNISLGMLYCMDLIHLRLIATIVFEAFACLVAGAMALCFHKKNRKADRDDSVLEGYPGFRYTT